MMLGHLINIYLNISSVKPNSRNKDLVSSILVIFLVFLSFFLLYLLNIVGNDVVMVNISSCV